MIFLYLFGFAMILLAFLSQLKLLTDDPELHCTKCDLGLVFVGSCFIGIAQAISETTLTVL